MKPSALSSREAIDRSREASTSRACGFDFNIDVCGDLHIHNNCAGETKPPAPGDTPPCFPPPATGNTCLPPVAGRKHKASPAQKLATLAANARAPSALAAGAMHLVRRFLAGASPANELERAAFARLAKAPAQARSTLACAAQQVEGLPGGQRSTLFNPKIDGLDVGTPLDPQVLTAAFGAEIVQRAGLATFGVTEPEERPGRIRVFEPGVESFFSQVRICTINGLRTANFIPPVPSAGYRPEEIAHDCTTTLVNGQPQVTCQVRVGNCVGGQIDGGVCLKVPTLAAGDGVVLQGVNFFSVDAKVLMTARAPGSGSFELDAHVVGDIETQVNEIVDGQTRLINDCRVHDRIGVTLPADMPPGFYEMQVAVPNITGIPSLGTRLTSNSEIVEVVPPVTARFQITAETLRCRGETSPASFGSDEVGLRFLAMPLNADLTTGPLTEVSRRFGDVDSGEQRNIDRLIFNQTAPMVAVALLVMGHEVDGEDAYQNMVTSVSDIFVDLVKEQAKFIAGALSAAGIGASALKAVGGWAIVVVAIAVAITLAIDLIIACWAPADLIIEDPTGYSITDLAERTSPAFPLPPVVSFKSEGGIQVDSTPKEKIPLQYREMREYDSSDEESSYQVTYRFNRVA
ncbi:MAG: hypothetical protein JWN94_1221 [Betaproteobacteria bacterium]|nr:hypothetical protein [Betaproteobacteria bacterium]